MASALAGVDGARLVVLSVGKVMGDYRAWTTLYELDMEEQRVVDLMVDSAQATQVVLHGVWKLNEELLPQLV